jgi:hypothetical protein
MIDASYTAAETMVLNPLWNKVSSAFLSSYITYWQGQDRITDVAEPLLNNSICFSISTFVREMPCVYSDQVSVPGSAVRRDFYALSRLKLGNRTNLYTKTTLPSIATTKPSTPTLKT